MKIEIPTTCPTCDAKLEQVNSQLFCRNSECEAQSSKRLEAFTKKMNIKGFGPKTLEKLDLKTFQDLYTIDLDSMKDVLGEKTAVKLFAEIEKSKTTSFWRFLSALSIPLIGDTAAKKVAKLTTSLNEITEEGLEAVGIGPKARDSILSWLEDNLPIQLPISFEANTTNEIQDKGTVCITGKLNNFKNRTDAKEYLESLGYKVTTSVTSKTDYLVDEEGRESSKSKKAKQLNIKIVTIKQLEETENE